MLVPMPYRTLLQPQVALSLQYTQIRPESGDADWLPLGSPIQTR